MKRLITKEIINEVEKMLKCENCVFSKYDISPNETFSIGGISIIVSDGASRLDLPENVSGEYFKGWLHDVGKILSKDINKNSGERVFELCANGKKALLHKITEDEMESAVESEFNHVQIADFWYTILKVTSESVPYSYNEQILDLDDANKNECFSCIIDISEGDTEQDTYDEYSESMALFDEENEINEESDNNSDYE